jgi:hypothetical protein
MVRTCLRRLWNERWQFGGSAMRRQGKVIQRPSLAIGTLAAGLLGATAASAAAPCTAAGIEALDVPGVTAVVSANVLGPSAQNPVPLCQVAGTIETDDNQAGFQANLPISNWNHKFLFFGVGGLAGDTLPEAFGSANVIDQLEAPAKGYAVLLTDTGRTA